MARTNEPGGKYHGVIGREERPLILASADAWCYICSTVHRWNAPCPPVERPGAAESTRCHDDTQPGTASCTQASHRGFRGGGPTRPSLSPVHQCPGHLRQAGGGRSGGGEQQHDHRPAGSATFWPSARDHYRLRAIACTRAYVHPTLPVSASPDAYVRDGEGLVEVKTTSSVWADQPARARRRPGPVSAVAGASQLCAYRGLAGLTIALVHHRPRGGLHRAYRAGRGTLHGETPTASLPTPPSIIA